MNGGMLPCIRSGAADMASALWDEVITISSLKISAGGEKNACKVVSQEARGLKMSLFPYIHIDKIFQF